MVNFEFHLIELIEDSELKLKKLENYYLDSNRFSNEKELLEQLNFYKGRIDGYNKVLNHFKKI